MIRRSILLFLRQGRDLHFIARYFHTLPQEIDLILWNGLGR